MMALGEMQITCSLSLALKKSSYVARNAQQVCYHQADIRMRSQRLLWLNNNKSVASLMFTVLMKSTWGRLYEGG